MATSFVESFVGLLGFVHKVNEFGLFIEIV